MLDGLWDECEQDMDKGLVGSSGARFADAGSGMAVGGAKGKPRGRGDARRLRAEAAERRRKVCVSCSSSSLSPWTAPSPPPFLAPSSCPLGQHPPLPLSLLLHLVPLDAHSINA
jgi:hypothetical protein